MLPKFLVKPSLLLFSLFFNIHKSLIENISLIVSTIDMVRESGSMKAFTMKPRWKCVSLSKSLDSSTQTFIQGIFHFHTICLKDDFHIFIFFYFVRLVFTIFHRMMVHSIREKECTSQIL